MTICFRPLSIRLLIGSALILLPLVYFSYTGVSWFPLRPEEHLIQNGLAYAFLVLFTYVNHTVLVPHWFLTKRYGSYALIATSCVFVAAYFPHRIEQWAYFKAPPENTPVAWIRQLFVEEMMMRSIPQPVGDRTDEHTHFKPAGKPPRQLRPSSPFPPINRPTRPLPLYLPAKLAIFFLLGSVSTLLSVSVLTASRLRQVETDQLQAELRQLKAQIQPHFLFNTLNSIYALAVRQDPRTADTIVKLSEFMRYIIRDVHQGKVALGREIDYIGNYIDLQQARLRDAVQIDFQWTGEEKAWQIAPLLLFSFVENAFKYGVSPEEASPIDIHVRMVDDQLDLYVANNKPRIHSPETSTGVGLQNTRERLRLLYPGKHQLTINNTSTHYQVHLTLVLST